MNEKRIRNIQKIAGTLVVFVLLVLPTLQSICGKADTPQLSISNPILTELSNPLLLLQPPENPVQGGNNPDHVIDPNGPDDDEGSEDPDPCNPDTQFGLIYPENQTMYGGYDYTALGGIEILIDKCNCRGPYANCTATYPYQENASEQIFQPLTRFGPNIINGQCWDLDAKSSVYCETYYSEPPPFSYQESSCVFTGDYSASAQVSGISFNAESFTDHRSIYELYKCDLLPEAFRSYSSASKLTQPVHVSVPFAVNLQGMIIVPASTLVSKIHHEWNCGTAVLYPQEEEARAANAFVSSSWTIIPKGFGTIILGSSLSLSETKYVSVEDPEMMFTLPYCGVYRDISYVFDGEFDTHGYTEPLPPCTYSCNVNTFEKIFAKGWFEVILCYVPVDLGIDSNNDGTINMDDDCVELDGYGKLIPWNDQYHPDPDNLVEVRLNTEANCAGSSLNDFRWRLAYPSAVRVWRDKNRTDIVHNMVNYAFPAPTSLWVEGLEESSDLGDVTIFLSTVHEDQPYDAIVTDSVVCTVVKVDLDVDSNNNNGFNMPQFNQDEDIIEESSPGKIIWVAHNLTSNPNNLSTEFYDLFPMGRSPLYLFDDLLGNFEITLSKIAGPGQVRIFAIRPNVEYPIYFPDFIEVPLGTNIRDDFFLSNSHYRYFKWYIAGVEPGELDLELKFKNDESEIKDIVRITVIKIESVSWQVIPNSGTIVDSNPNTGGGKRIFPDLNNQADTQSHDSLYCDIQITPPIPGVLISLQVFDVDDPSTNFVIVDDENDMFDNKNLLKFGMLLNPENSDLESDGTIQIETDSYGFATVIFSVGYNPGDNYRIVADLAYYYWINYLHVPSNDALARVVNGEGDVVPENQMSELLTVWRRLWIEADHMNYPGNDQYLVTGQITDYSLQRDCPVVGVTTVDLEQNLPNELDDICMYEGGMFIIPSLEPFQSSFEVLWSSSNFLIDDTVIIRGVPEYIGGSCDYILQDDDIFMTPTVPIDYNLITNAFSEAYILPQIISEYEDIVPFDLHLSSSEVLNGEGTWNDYKDLQRLDREFWSNFVVGAWEPDEDYDGDPDCQEPLPWPLGWGLLPVGGSIYPFYIDIEDNDIVLFLQTIHDYSILHPLTDSYHLFLRGIGAAGGAICEYNTITDENLSKSCTFDYFGPLSINAFRSKDTW